MPVRLRRRLGSGLDPVLGSGGWIRANSATLPCEGFVPRIFRRRSLARAPNNSPTRLATDNNPRLA